MHDRRTGAGWAVVATAATLTAVVAVAATAATPAHPDAPLSAPPPLPVACLLAASFLVLALLGTLVGRRVPANPVGVLLTVSGSAFLLGLATEAVARTLFLRGHAGAVTSVSSWIDSWAWTIAIGVALIAVALFPTGRPASRLFSIAIWLVTASTAVEAFATALQPGRIGTASHEVNPFGLHAAAGALHTAGAIAAPIGAIGGLLSLVSVVVRFRRSRDEEHQQLRWLGLAAAVTVLAMLITSGLSPLGISIGPFVFVTAILTLPSAMAVGVLRYRLYDIDLVVNRLLLSALLVSAIGSLYAAITVGVGVHLLGRDHPGTGESIVAVAVVAVVVQPLRDRLRRLSDKIVYGRRATPYQVLDAFAEEIGGRWSLHELAPRLASLLADATGAAATAVFIRTDDVLIPVAQWPAGADAAPAVPVGVDLTAHLDVGSSDALALVTHAGETVGALVLRKAPGDRVSGADARVLQQISTQSGLALGNLRLTAELERHAEEVARSVEELRKSRQRLVTAAEAERNRIGRDIHDGAQQDLVALMAKARLAQNQIARDPAEAEATLVEVQADAKGALANLRELARGIAPPLLADRGLVVAVGSRLSRLPIQSKLAVGGDAGGRRFPSAVEGAAWFVVSESLANALKHADARSVTVSIDSDDHELRLEVVDDGCGINGNVGHCTGITGMTDRIGALGGHLEVVAGLSSGTVVRATIPAASR